MNTESIKTFIMLSKLKNFTRTAERMYVAQSTVTNRIGELENETGKRLFVRKQGGVELTEEGELFLGYAERIAELEDTFIQQVNAAAHDAAGGHGRAFYAPPEVFPGREAPSAQGAREGE